MRRSLSILILLLSFISASAAEAGADSIGHQSVGLVLSGGGAKGIAHIGVIKALEDNDIPIDYVTGTSMGAIVGGLYSSGYTPEEMLDLILSQDFSYWSTGLINPEYKYYLNRVGQTPVMFSFPLGRPDSSNTYVPQSLISPVPMNFAFMELFSAITAQTGRNFNKLMVPFRCVASDVDAKHKVVLSKGSLGDAIRASMSFPAVFQPTKVDGALLYDGGIYDNFPVDVMRSDFAPSIMIGVDVSTEESGPQTSIIDQLSNMIVQNNDYSLPANEGIKLRINLNEFGLLDFPKARRIYQIGYDHATKMIDSIRTRIKTRTDTTAVKLRRHVFKSKTPYLCFDSVSVTGGTRRQNAFINYLFRRNFRNDTLSVEGAKRAYYMAISTDKLTDLGVQASYNDSTGKFGLHLKASVKDNFRGSVGGYLTSSSNSYIFLSAGYSTLSFNSVSAKLNAWIGQSDMAASAYGSIYLPTSTPSRLTLEAVLSRRKFYEKDYLFYEERMPTFILGHQYFGRLSWALAASYLGKFEVGAGFGHLDDSFYRDNLTESYLEGRDHARHNLGQLFMSYTSGTLDDINFPTRGHYYLFKTMGFMGKFNYLSSDPGVPGQKSHPKWAQAEINTRNYFTVGRKWTLGLESEIMLSTRKLYESYNASIVSAPVYAPTPAANNTFNPAFRANSYAALGIVPVYRYNDNISARLFMSGFMPLRKIMSTPDGVAEYGKWLSNPSFFSEFDLSFHMPFATVSAYVNYSSTPARNWNVGISFGIYMHSPDFLR